MEESEAGKRKELQDILMRGLQAVQYLRLDAVEDVAIHVTAAVDFLIAHTDPLPDPVEQAKEHKAVNSPVGAEVLGSLRALDQPQQSSMSEDAAVGLRPVPGMPIKVGVTVDFDSPALGSRSLRAAGAGTGAKPVLIQSSRAGRRPSASASDEEAPVEAAPVRAPLKQRPPLERSATMTSDYMSPVIPDRRLKVKPKPQASSRAGSSRPSIAPFEPEDVNPKEKETAYEDGLLDRKVKGLKADDGEAPASPMQMSTSLLLMGLAMGDKKKQELQAEAPVAASPSWIRRLDHRDSSLATLVAARAKITQHLQTALKLIPGVQMEHYDEVKSKFLAALLLLEKGSMLNSRK